MIDFGKAETQLTVCAANEIIKIAAEGAIGKVPYIPSKEVAESFVPHAWVVNAVVVGMMAGMVKGSLHPNSAPTLSELRDMLQAIASGFDIQTSGF